VGRRGGEGEVAAACGGGWLRQWLKREGNNGHRLLFEYNRDCLLYFKISESTAGGDVTDVCHGVCAAAKLLGVVLVCNQILAMSE
jgi:hypothetical protein